MRRLPGGPLLALWAALLPGALAQPTPQGPESGPLRLGPSQMFKLVLSQPYGSNRLEYDMVVPLRETESLRTFVDAKVFAQEQPLIDPTPGTGFIQAYGQSARLGVRGLVERGTGFWGASAGYDSLWQQGAYFQQAGLALEYNRQDYQLVLTSGVPFSAPSLQLAPNTPLASVNLQLSLPTGYPGLAVQPRVYVVGSDSTGSAVGGQLQFTYSFARTWSATLASNYDALTGASGSLTFQVVLPQRSGAREAARISPTMINGFAGAVGNNGSRVIRLDNEPASSGN